MLNDNNIIQYIADNKGSGEYLLRDAVDGSGQYIAKWDMDIPKPTEEQLIYAASIVETNNAYKPPELDVLLDALEKKSGITKADKDASRQALIDAKA